ncbi:hypothetical protein [Streptomyces litchfieldiae]|uniref:Uncharacterized protein n=1 Tax=Streptomyces litchfieldiae TaxID=3075543 RepID=A0ABU2MI84_9ACTN|nr:hypothetical protein [Streptomyces sp. DSM 44938]MDT0341284.1 hypothetical protein [Streptomyces sp. DSM 44938]
MDDILINIDAHRGVESEVAKRQKLATMMDCANRIGSDNDMFGEVPNGAQAAAALRAAVASVTQQVMAGGQAAEDIQLSASAAARTGEQTDQAAAQALAQAQVEFDIAQMDASGQSLRSFGRLGP